MSTSLLKRVAGLKASSKNSALPKILLPVRPQNHLVSSVLCEKKTRKKTRAAILDDFKEKISYWKLRDEALDPTMWGTCSSETVDLSQERLNNYDDDNGGGGDDDDIYIYMTYRTANLQTLHFKYLSNKYPY
jgi:hypothetical protein